MSRKHRFRKRKSVNWTASELQELRTLGDPDVNKFLEMFDNKSDCLVQIRCLRALALEAGISEEVEDCDHFLDYLGESPDLQLRDWKRFAFLNNHFLENS